MTVGDDFTVRLDLLPEPFYGNPRAPVVLLNLNPGYSDDDLPHHRDPSFAQLSRWNLVHRHKGYPFYWIAPSLSAPGRRWWEHKLGSLIGQVGREAVATGVLCVEYFPYHSRRFGHRKLNLPSQQYSFGIVRSALRRKAVVKIMRGERLWTTAVPELASYQNLHRVNSVQNPAITPKNCKRGYECAVAHLKASVSAQTG